MFDADVEVILLDRNEQHFQCHVVDRCSCLFYQFPNLLLVITFVFVDSCSCFKSQDQWQKVKGHTFKSHIRAGWKLITLERDLELLLQGGTSDLDILLLGFVRIIHLRDEVVKFSKDRHNRNFSGQSR